jgi:enoyl-CoA hydratase/carnithine racemase
MTEQTKFGLTEVAAGAAIEMLKSHYSRIPPANIARRMAVAGVMAAAGVLVGAAILRALR